LLLSNSFRAKIEYAKYRIERSKEDLEAAIAMFEACHFRVANNRAYYSIFHAMRAVLAFDGFDSKKHSGIISEFRKSYIKSGIFSEELSSIIGLASEIRNASDYDDMFIASKEETEKQIKDAELFHNVVKRYIDEKVDLYS
jgi:uncharacterized protein (UPF0332 family)